MTDLVGPSPKRVPGMVILAAVLNFISAFFAALVMLLTAAAAAFGNMMQLNQFVSERLSRFSNNGNVNYGLFALLAIAFVVALCFLIFFLVTGIGLLKGRKFAWYLQITLSLFGLLGFISSSVFLLVFPAIPVVAILNIIILVSFFKGSTRAYFNV